MEWNGMEWNGMEWNEMEWNGMEWNGMEWNEMEWNGMEWNGMEWNGMEWNGMKWNGLESRAVAWRNHSPPPDIKLCNITPSFVFFTSPVNMASSYIRRRTSGGALEPIFKR